MPQRIQRKRSKGWRMPEGAVYVGRPTKWGNPWRAADFTWAKTEASDVVVQKYRQWMEGRLMSEATPVPPQPKELRGKDLACWCPLDQPCHADVLLELANAGRS